MRPPKPFANKDWDPFRSLEGMVRLALITIWDPIGVFGHPEALNEYDNYVLPVVGLLINGATVEELEIHLQNIHKEKMSIGMNAWTTRTDRLTAETLVAAYANFKF